MKKLLMSISTAILVFASVSCKKEEAPQAAPEAQSEPKVDRQEQLNETMANMKQLGLSLLMYTDDNNGHYPETFDQLTTVDKNMDKFVSPLSKTSAPKSAEEIKNGQTDFLYFTQYSSESAVKHPANEISMVLKPQYAVDGIIPVLYYDGHVSKEKLTPKLLKTIDYLKLAKMDNRLLIINCTEKQQNYQARHSLKLIARALNKYKEKNQGNYPSSLDQLIKYGAKYENFICAKSPTLIPTSTDQIKNGQTDFIYLYRKNTETIDNPDKEICIILKPEYAYRNKAPVLYYSGRMSFMNVTVELERAIKKAQSNN